ncbi:exopolysaccharide biosynthesis protein [Jannaschia donghaensis]|uniref:Exopolysaccharide synthesis, ExoD n=1 Tax=Jannaschia donghaensis TaxID=420998 RepID=A0A0M6YLJ6_9RHOB|nr:exopolysaccharide biosynthesis protein [Jannaschia donghaensis]CTQ50800.1 Exopolysaccharide synthesis, ExoD [Jannaschia donghaensis]
MTKPTEIVEGLEEAVEGDDKVTVGEVNEELGNRGIGALLMVPASLELTPVGGIPGVPTLLAVIVALVAAQILFGRDRIWLPDVLSRRSIEQDKFTTAVGKLRPAARWADDHLGRHIPLLVDPPAPRIVSVAILLLCATVPGLELVPFASSIPMGTIVLFGLALVTRDGRVMALAWAAFAAACLGVWALWP